MITAPVAVAGTLFLILAVLFWANSFGPLKKFFNVIPLIVFVYFIPTILSNTGILPMDSPAYDFIKKTLLPASLLLFALSVDLPAIMKLGPKVLIMFFGATLSVFLGSLFAFSTAGWLIPAADRAEAWKGLAALCGSWIGGGANFLAVGQSIGASQTIMGLMVIVDVIIASIWMAILFYFAGREKEMDDKIGADRRASEELRNRIEKYQSEIARPTNHVALIQIGMIAITGTAFCTYLASFLPVVGTIINGFTWVVILITFLGVILSFTPVRKLEGQGASAVGTTFLYLLVAVIGAQGNFKEIGSAPGLIAVGALWMLFHAVFMLVLRRIIKAPIFFLAVGSQANIGAAASAPVVASAFHPSFAIVGLLLAILGYVLGTYVALVNAYFLEMIYKWLFV